ncbi:hypothetical protein EVAR_87058_1 [Eumeta japonica]|uniref:Uncharacterized protein n=1 Tax=Eumeta variegata TaxID=151549 RepID=A0A4C1VR09_EUMVA|nr:hypothetical protein EVAR_87058_1 [Eumeta japonica]
MPEYIRREKALNFSATGKYNRGYMFSFPALPHSTVCNYLKPGGPCVFTSPGPVLDNSIQVVHADPLDATAVVSTRACNFGDADANVKLVTSLGFHAK